MTDKHEHTPGMVMPEKKPALPKEAAKSDATGTSKPKEPVAKPAKRDEGKHQH